MKQLLWGALGLTVWSQPGHALGVVCKAIPSAVYNASSAPVPPEGSAARVPADLAPQRDDWALRPVTTAIKRDMPAAGEVTVAEAGVDPATGQVSVNGTPLQGGPADTPKHVIVCRATEVDNAKRLP